MTGSPLWNQFSDESIEGKVLVTIGPQGFFSYQFQERAESQIPRERGSLDDSVEEQSDQALYFAVRPD